jgi:hypothetical protein
VPLAGSVLLAGAVLLAGTVLLASTVLLAGAGDDGDVLSRSRCAWRPPPYTLCIWMVTLDPFRRYGGEKPESSFAAFRDKNRIYREIRVLSRVLHHR